jgi:hypothetical protein
MIGGDKAYGGCILAKGDLLLEGVAMTGCSAIGQTKAVAGAAVSYGSITATASRFTGNSATAIGVANDLAVAGGALFGVVGVALYDSILSGNTVATTAGSAYGGAFVGGLDTVIKYSTLSGNAATAGGNGDFAYGGAAAIIGNATVLATTVDHNTADAAGGLSFAGGDVYSASITNSTISGNEGRVGLGALQARELKMSLSQTTVAFNTSGSLAPVAVTFNGAATLNTTILADNTGKDVAASAPITGARNIIKIKDAATTVPVDTITLDPQLGPLQFNGGPTRTHAPGIGSPAIDAGTASSLFYTFDQRGPTFLRLVGAGTDIGAFEVDADHIFGAAFEYVSVP